MPITSPALKGVGALIGARSYAPLFPIDLVAKDFRYILTAAADVSSPLPTADAVRAVFERARDEGFGGDNIHGVAKLYEPGS